MLRFALAALLSITLTAAAGAQEPEEIEQRWYQVELLIFSNEQVSTQEQWPPLPQLSYPEAARFLVEPGRMESNLLQQISEVESSEMDEFGRQIIVLKPAEELPQQPLDAWEVTPDMDAAEDSTLSTEAPSLDTLGDPNDPNSPGWPLDPNAPADPNDVIPDPTTPSPFISLPRFEREFDVRAAQMARSGRHQVLFHQAWRQPMLDKDSSLPIIVDRSGDTLTWPRLQGSIKLYLSRYLHLHTDLWLNTQGHYLPGQWQMPAPPLGPPSVIIEQAEPANLFDPNNPDLDSDWVLFEDESELQEDRGAIIAAADELESEEEINGELAPESELETGPLYPFRHAVSLRQERRMRGEEVHYLDHPMFGLVIRLTPLDADTLRVMAREEAGLPLL